MNVTHKTYRVEWIGAASPQADDRVVYRKLMRKYTQEQLDLLDQATKRIIPIIRQPGKTARLLTPRMGFSREYQFGPKRGTYVREMFEEDVKRLFSDDFPDGPEFKNLDDPSHADRKPIVPWEFIDRVLYDLLKEAAAGPIVVVSDAGTFKNPRELIAEYERRFDVEKAERERQKYRQQK